VPIPYRVDVADGAGNVIGNAATIIRTGFDHWLPLIQRLGVLAGDGWEDSALRDVLFRGRRPSRPPPRLVRKSMCSGESRLDV
jgi:hypothetical protein